MKKYKKLPLISKWYNSLISDIGEMESITNYFAASEKRHLSDGSKASKKQRKLKGTTSKFESSI